MATISISIQDSLGNPAVTWSQVTDDGNMAYFIEAYAVRNFPGGIFVSEVLATDGVTVITPSSVRSPTNQEVMNAMGNELWIGVCAIVNSYLQSKAAQAAMLAAPQVS